MEKSKKRIFRILTALLVIGLACGIYSRYEKIHLSLMYSEEVNNEIKETLGRHIPIALQGLKAEVNGITDDAVFSTYITDNKIKDITITPKNNKQADLDVIEKQMNKEIIETTKQYSSKLLMDQNISYWIKDNKSGKTLFSDESLQHAINNPTLPEQYRLLIIMTFDEEGNLSSSNWMTDSTSGDFFTPFFMAERFMNGSTYSLDVTYYNSQNNDSYYVNLNFNFPKDMTYIFAVEKDLAETGILQVDSHYDSYDSWYALYALPYMGVAIMIVAIWIFIYPYAIVEQCGPFRYFKNWKLEIWVPVFGAISGYSYLLLLALIAASSNGQLQESLQYMRLQSYSSFIITGINICAWIVALYLVMIIAFIIKVFFHKGIKKYFLENTVISWIASLCNSTFAPKIKSLYKKIQDGWKRLKAFDLNDKKNRILILIVLVNCIVMFIACSLSLFGWIIAFFYSIALLVFLHKYYQKIHQDYSQLLNATKQLSEGNFDMKINEDLGAFNSLGQSFTSIKDGFEKAVHEEVKSQRMKTELISNVSHDLKTPLTSIITYVDLLKNENLCEEERKKYIDTLDRNSLRLKTLIEDLFEVSKATSGNIHLNIVNVDIVSLISQAQFECMDKIQEMNLDFKTHFSQDKIICPLDSSKTYRIFENLLTNICKYALPHTRVYIDVKEMNEEVMITFKNISANEIDFDVDEIVERFVQGDKSRNANGSGLGLAIAKSFTELQGGSFKIEVDGDLFKAIVIFKKKPSSN